MTHRNVSIQFTEAHSFTEPTYTVSPNYRGMVYRATSIHGVAYGTDPQQTLKDAQAQIDRALDNA